MKSRPFGVTVLAILAGIVAALSAFHALQALGLFPYLIGPYNGIEIRAFNLWGFLMWGLLVWVYVWLVQMLWNVQKEAWLFLAVISVFNLIMDFTLMLGQGDWSDVSVHFIFNALILIYAMLPGVKAAFDTGSAK
jgi:hypothetical protein